MVLAYHAQLNSVDDATRIEAAKAWSKWECVGDPFVIFQAILIIFTHRMATSKLYVDPSYLQRAESDVFAK